MDPELGMLDHVQAAEASTTADVRCAVVFDFDETLAVETGHPRSEPVQLFGGYERILELRQLLTDLQSAGITLCIISFNALEIIGPLLRAAGLFDFFDTSLAFGYEAFEKGGALHGATGSMRGAQSWNKGTLMRLCMEPTVLPQDEESADFAVPYSHGQTITVPSDGTIDARAPMV